MKKIQVPKLDRVHSALDGYTMQALDTDPVESLALLEANAKARGIEVVAAITRQFTPERSGFLVVTFDPRRVTPAQEP